MTFIKHIRTFVFILTCIATPISHAQTNNKTKCDSAIISFKNETEDTLKFIHAAIKGKEIAVFNLVAGQTSKKFHVPVCGRNLFRFSIFKDNLEDKDSIEPIDYFDQVSNEEIKQATYIYHIDYKDGQLEIKLEKQVD